MCLMYRIHCVHTLSRLVRELYENQNEYFTQYLQSKLAIIFALNKSLKYISSSIRLSRHLKIFEGLIKCKDWSQVFFPSLKNYQFYYEINIIQYSFHLYPSPIQSSTMYKFYTMKANFPILNNYDPGKQSIGYYCNAIGIKIL